VSDLREYTAIKYAGDCKCGNCRLIPRQALAENIADHDVMMAALRLIEYVSRKDSLTDAERLEGVRSTVVRALAVVGSPREQT
jgi:hypothetical protein